VEILQRCFTLNPEKLGGLFYIRSTNRILSLFRNNPLNCQPVHAFIYCLNAGALMFNPGSNLPVYLTSDGWKFTPEQGWTCPPILLDSPLDQSIQIGENFSEGGVVLGDPWQDGKFDKNTIAHPQIGLRATFALKAARQYLDESNPEKGCHLTEKDFLVSLKETHITPRPETKDPASQDGTDHTGWYVDQIDIEMGFENEPDGLSLFSSAPPTVSLTESVTSSISRTLSVGFFGETATGSASETMSNEFGYSLEDFATVNNQTNTKLVQRVTMQISKGGPYEKPADLQSSSIFGQRGGLWKDPTAVPPLYELPLKAISSLNLGCQGLWVVPGETRATARFVIKITPRFVHMLTRQQQPWEVKDPFNTPLQWFVDIDVESPTFTWTFDVDFSSVGYSK
jgi:hypothetical protein